jgi:hypothetical protein
MQQDDRAYLVRLVQTVSALSPADVEAGVNDVAARAKQNIDRADPALVWIAIISVSPSPAEYDYADLSPYHFGESGMSWSRSTFIADFRASSSRALGGRDVGLQGVVNLIRLSLANPNRRRS